jgi:signal transduction histidine kinase
LDTNEKNASAANTPQQATQPSNSLDFQMRRSTSRAENNDVRNPENRNGAWSLNTLALNRPTSELIVGSMAPVWLPSHEKPEQLLFVRAGMSGVVPIYQGFILDWPKLRELLRKEIGDLFENVEFHPLPEKEPLHPEKAMSTLPIELEVLDAAPMQPEPIQSVNIATWTPLRLGLLVAWLSSLIALSAVGLVGWSLMALSERRIRFVSAVTHELRTPLTTIRLYLDMLQQGMVTEEKQRNEYLGTLNGEADRLNRLIGNVLDYARLEKQSIPIRTQAIVLRTFLDSIKNLWQERCREASKELIIESEFPSDFDFCSDQPLLERILSNLIDNARKYSSPASEPGIWLRATRRGNRLRFEVEDKGPGVARKDRRSIFRAFRRGGQADFQAGGVGLGLALAANWARMIGGRLRYAPKATGACFTLEIAITK